VLFGSLSLLSIGGGNAVLPEMHMQAVKGHHWLTDSQFADVFSISQAAPGPSILIVTLVGYGAGFSVGGVPAAIVGGVVATVAMIMPAATFM
jgi:chromate transporter